MPHRIDSRHNAVAQKTMVEQSMSMQLHCYCSGEIVIDLWHHDTQTNTGDFKCKVLFTDNHNHQSPSTIYIFLVMQVSTPHCTTACVKQPLCKPGSARHLGMPSLCRPKHVQPFPWTIAQFQTLQSLHCCGCDQRCWIRLQSTHSFPHCIQLSCSGALSTNAKERGFACTPKEHPNRSSGHTGALACQELGRGWGRIPGPFSLPKTLRDPSTSAYDPSTWSGVLDYISASTPCSTFHVTAGMEWNCQEQETYHTPNNRSCLPCLPFRLVACAEITVSSRVCVGAGLQWCPLPTIHCPRADVSAGKQPGPSTATTARFPQLSWHQHPCVGYNPQCWTHTQLAHNSHGNTLHCCWAFPRTFSNDCLVKASPLARPSRHTYRSAAPPSRGLRRSGSHSTASLWL